MRITQQGIARRVIEQTRSRMQQLAEAQQKMTTGRAVERPSDNPVDASEILALNSRISRAEQFSENIKSALSDLQLTEDGVSQLQNLLTRVRAIAVQGANDATGQSGRIALSQQIDAHLNEMVGLANTRHGSRYLFGGGRTSEQPYTTETDANGKIISVSGPFETLPPPPELIVSDGERISTGIAGDDLFELGGGGTMFDILFDLRQALDSNDGDAVREMIVTIDEALEQTNGLTAMIGARVSYASSLLEKLETYKLRTTDRLSEIADIDILDAVTRYNTEQTAYELALRSSARIIQPSLVNFL